MGWGKEWPKAAEDILKHDSGITPELLGSPIPNATLIGWDVGSKDKSVKILGKTDANGNLKIEKIYSNSMPTHDPYTNPDATIYYECGCGAILDPNTKSFAALNNHASEKGWKIRFTDKGYVPYCVKCGE